MMIIFVTCHCDLGKSDETTIVLRHGLGFSRLLDNEGVTGLQPEWEMIDCRVHRHIIVVNFIMEYCSSFTPP